MARYKKITTNEGNEIAVAIAEKALKDNEGNEIISTYAKKTEIPPVDSSLSTTSTNPVQNKVISAKLNDVDASLDSLDYHQINTTIAQWSEGYIDFTGKPQDINTIVTYKKIKIVLTYGNDTLTKYVERKNEDSSTGEISFSSSYKYNDGLIKYEILTYKPLEYKLYINNQILVTNESNFVDYNN